MKNLNKQNSVVNSKILTKRVMVLMAIIFLPFSAWSQQISNVRAEQEDYMVKLSYFLSGISEQNIQVYVSYDNNPFQGPLKAISGDVQDVLPGERSMVWDVLNEPGFEALVSKNVRFKVELVNKPSDNSLSGLNGFATIASNGLRIDPNWNSEIQEIVKNMIYVEGGAMNKIVAYYFGLDNEYIETIKENEKFTVIDFYIGKYEITQREWIAVMENNPSKNDNCLNCPVENVSFDDVNEFIKKVNRITGLNFNLPTSYQWEFAARGGNNTLGFKFSGGNYLEDVAWFLENSFGKTHPIGLKKANELGLFDMSGNVAEWCSSLFQGRLGQYIGRGGYYNGNIEECRLPTIYGYTGKHYRLGFRLVLNN